MDSAPAMAIPACGTLRMPLRREPSQPFANLFAVPRRCVFYHGAFTGTVSRVILPQIVPHDSRHAERIGINLSSSPSPWPARHPAARAIDKTRPISPSARKDTPPSEIWDRIQNRKGAAAKRFAATPFLLLGDSMPEKQRLISLCRSTLRHRILPDKRK